MPYLKHLDGGSCAALLRHVTQRAPPRGLYMARDRRGSCVASVRFQPCGAGCWLCVCQGTGTGAEASDTRTRSAFRSSWDFPPAALQASAIPLGERLCTTAGYFVPRATYPCGVLLPCSTVKVHCPCPCGHTVGDCLKSTTGYTYMQLAHFRAINTGKYG